MPQKKNPYTLRHTCPMCVRTFETTAPQRICCSETCRRRRLKLRHEVGAHASDGDDLVMARAAELGILQRRAGRPKKITTDAAGGASGSGTC
jgi:rRNA maturation protein Nop10